MLAYATEKTIADQPPFSNLFLPVPDTDFRDFLDEVEELARFAPEIIEAIKQDLEANARTKKHLRLADRKFGESRTADLPDFHVEEAELLADV